MGQHVPAIHQCIRKIILPKCNTITGTKLHFKSPVAERRHDNRNSVQLRVEIAQQQRDSDLALKSVLSELQFLKSIAMPQQSQDTNL
jgi:hypothetical protein